MISLLLPVLFQLPATSPHRFLRTIPPSLEPHILSTSSLSSASSLTVSHSPLCSSNSQNSAPPIRTVTLDSNSFSERDVLIGPLDLTDHVRRRIFLNQIVGSYANRLPSGKVEVEGYQSLVLDLKTTEGEGELTSRPNAFRGWSVQRRGNDGLRAFRKLMTNAHPKTNVCLHGGTTGIDKVDWELIANPAAGTTTASTLFSDKATSSSEAIYRHLSPHGADAFPRDLLIEAFVSLTEPKGDEKGVAGRLEVVLRAKIVEEKGAATAVDATPVNFDDSLGICSGSLLREICMLMVPRFYPFIWKGERTIELHDNKLPTGKIIQLSKDDLLNFSIPRKIGANFPENGIGSLSNANLPSSFPRKTDHNLIFSRTTSQTPQVTLTSPDWRLGLAFRTNQASVQCYTVAGFNGVAPVKKAVHDRKGEKRGYDQFGQLL
ncbi:BQ2448_3471 [Microbotryum intermedium]|uniref:BQ2448_3471 protein n=1 Tax=Microbotryum intermedium TaxID=269621 RepID=A0A238FD64_9BASI|nr:BQ2448_3471 [Microbotryum intermedium]